MWQVSQEGDAGAKQSWPETKDLMHGVNHGKFRTDNLESQLQDPVSFAEWKR